MKQCFYQVISLVLACSIGCLQQHVVPLAEPGSKQQNAAQPPGTKSIANSGTQQFFPLVLVTNTSAPREADDLQSGGSSQKSSLSLVDLNFDVQHPAVDPQSIATYAGIIAGGGLLIYGGVTLYLELSAALTEKKEYEEIRNTTNNFHSITDASIGTDGSPFTPVTNAPDHIKLILGEDFDVVADPSISSEKHQKTGYLGEGARGSIPTLHIVLG